MVHKTFETGVLPALQAEGEQELCIIDLQTGQVILEKYIQEDSSSKKIATRQEVEIPGFVQDWLKTRELYQTLLANKKFVTKDYYQFV